MAITSCRYHELRARFSPELAEWRAVCQHCLFDAGAISVSGLEPYTGKIVGVIVRQYEEPIPVCGHCGELKALHIPVGDKDIVTGDHAFLCPRHLYVPKT